MGRRKKPEPPAIEQYSVDSLSKYVSVDTICAKYDLSPQQVKSMARMANAFKEVRKASLINRTLFYLEYRELLEEVKIDETLKTIKYDEAIEPVRKVYMRYEEAAEFYSMSLTCFKALANQAEAVRHYHSVALVNLDVIDLYIEENC